MLRIPQQQPYHRRPKRLPQEQRFSNYCLEFDGTTDQQITVPAFNLVAPYTMIKWIRYTVGAINQLAIWRRAGTFYFGVVGTGQLYLRAIDGVGYTSPVAFAGILGIWQMIGIRALDDSTFNFILNDTLSAAVAVVAGTIENNVIMTIGRNAQLPHNWDGGIDEFFHVGRALTERDLQDVWHRGYARPMAGSLLNLRMEEGSGLTVFDTSGAGNHGTLVNNPAWTRVAKYELLAESGV